MLMSLISKKTMTTCSDWLNFFDPETVSLRLFVAGSGINQRRRESLD